MPRPNDPGTITVGGGLASADSIETNSFIHPTGGQEGLRVHIQDPSRAHNARAIFLLDTPDNFLSDNVEGALEEIVGAAASGRTNGLIEGGLFTSSVGLVFELDTLSLVIIDGSLGDYTGEQVALAPNATQYVFVNTVTTLLTVSGSPPPLNSAPVLLWEITTDGAGIIGSRDLRFFAFNLDRKVPLTVRSSGSLFNQASEAQFLSLEGVMAYLELYAGTGADPVETHRIVLRGNHDIASTLLVPVDGVVFEGDGTGVITSTALTNPLFNLDGKSRIKFKNLGFISDVGASVAIASTTDVNGLSIEQCTFGTSGTPWSAIVALTGTANTNTVIRDCVVTGIDGDAFSIERPTGLVIENVRVTAAASTAGTSGIALNAAAGSATSGEGSCTISNCTVDGFTESVVSWVNSLVVENCLLTDARQGLTVGGSQMTFNDNVILLSSDDSATTGALTGISLEIGSNISVTGCDVSCPRVAWTAGDAPSGVRIANTGTVGKVHLDGCNISGFYNTTLLTGDGVGHDDTIDDFKMTNCVIEGGARGASVEGNRIVVSGCSFTDVDQGIQATSSNRIVLSDNHIELSTSNGLKGIVLTNSDEAVVQGNHIRNPRSVWSGVVPVGIEVFSSQDVGISGCHIQGFLDTTIFAGFGVDLVSTCANVRISDTLIRTTLHGVNINANTSDHTLIDTCIIDDCRIGVYSNGDYTRVSNCDIELSQVDDARGAIYGIQFLRFFGYASNCRISNGRRWLSGPTGDIPMGIFYSGSGVGGVSACRIRGFYNEADVLGNGIGLSATARELIISGSHIDFAAIGVDVAMGASRITISDCNLDGHNRAINILGTGSDDRFVIDNVRIELDNSRGVEGIVLDSVDTAIIRGCEIQNPRSSSWGGAQPVGIDLTTAGTDITITGCRIEGFYNSTDNLGHGVRSADTVGLTITSTTVFEAEIGIDVLYGSVGERVRITACAVREATVGIRSQVGLTLISGNQIQGTSDRMNAGIWVEGLAGGNNRGSVVSNNTVESCNNSHIFLDGMVVSGTVSGNTIDGLLDSDPLNPTGQGVLVFGQPTRQPIQITVTDNAVERCAVGIIVRGSSVADVAEDITIGNNTIRYCGFAQDLTGGSPDTFVGKGAMGIGAEFVESLNIVGNNVSRMGQISNNAGTALFPDLGGSINGIQTLGVYCRNSSRVNVSGNQITDMYSLNLGESYGIAVEQRSTGLAGNYSRRMFTVNDNQVFWGTGIPGGPGIYGIIVSTERGTDAGFSNTMRDVTVQNNNVLRCEKSGITVSAGEDSRVDQVLISGNQLSVVAQGGAGSTAALQVLGDNTSVATFDPAFLANVTISNNQTDDGETGIQVLNLRDGDITGVLLSDNRVRNTGTDGILVRQAGTGLLFDVQVLTNTVDSYGQGGGGSGIVVQSPVTANDDTRRISVCGNSLSTASSVDGGIGVLVSSGALLDCDISNNTVSSLVSGSGILVNDPVIYVNQLVVDDITRLTIDNNIVFVSNQDAIEVRSDGLLNEVSISGNTLEGGGVNDAISLRIFYGSDPAPSNSYHDQVRVSGNHCRDFNIGLDVEVGFGTKIRNWHVTGNTFREMAFRGFITSWSQTVAPAGAGNSWENVHIKDNVFDSIRGEGIILSLNAGGGGSADMDPMVNTFITGNSFTACATDSINDEVIVLIALTRIRNLRIADNHFEGCKGGDTDSTGVIQLQIGTVSTSSLDTCENISIDNNSFVDCDGIGILMFDAPAAAAQRHRIAGMSITNNNFRRQLNDCIRLELAEFDTARAITISNNTIDGVDKVGINSNLGIVVAGPVLTSLDHVNISDNIVHDCGNGTSIGAVIHVDMPNTGQNITVSGNTIDNATDRGIYVYAAGLLNSCTVAGNQLLAVSGSAGTGIFVESGATLANAGLDNVVVSNNILNNVTGSGIIVQTDTNGFGSRMRSIVVEGNAMEGPGGSGVVITSYGNILGMSIAGNQIYSPTIVGIQLNLENAEGATDFENIAITGNGVRASGSAGIQVDHDATISNLAITGNVVKDAGQDAAIYVNASTSAGSILGMSITGNTINDANGHGIEWLGFTSSNAVSVVISSNAIYDVEDDAISCRAGLGEVDSLVISNNTIRNFSVDGAASYKAGIQVEFDDLRGLVVTGNSIATNFDYSTGLLFEQITATSDWEGVVVSNNQVYLNGDSNANSVSMDWSAFSAGRVVNGASFVGNSFRNSRLGITIDSANIQFQRSTVSGNNERTHSGGGETAGTWAAFVLDFSNSQSTGLNQD